VAAGWLQVASSRPTLSMKCRVFRFPPCRPPRRFSAVLGNGGAFFAQLDSLDLNELGGSVWTTAPCILRIPCSFYGSSDALHFTASILILRVPCCCTPIPCRIRRSGPSRLRPAMAAEPAPQFRASGPVCPRPLVCLAGQCARVR
jgi:hypothetical protein